MTESRVDNLYSAMYATMGCDEALEYCESMIKSVPDYEDKKMWMETRKRFVDSKYPRSVVSQYGMATDQTLVEGWEQ